ncbi:non-ribosomal peptide synthase/polyketide synthase [Marinobacter sp. BGYM27]|uniref:non-ribosomal peptide synthase/polyketide synthase n=1 Tax=Marinobacter sp. BGYM27 TaxID=2975597 RepID=UPI0021A62098|nr:non-ribosomal peptide synthase/polyketide synthase [Marinobacter sp. BGYM27]MDG5498192.1 non-ribosomal peptide synthase/polyketide synthase [Marinobacter sp. BGYM27]
MQGNALALSRRFIELEPAKRRVFLGKLEAQGLSLSALPIPVGAAGDSSPASSAQQRLWFIDQLEPGNSAYHLPGALRLLGRVDESAIQAAFNVLAERHHSLRTVFQADDQGEPLQCVQPAQAITVESMHAVDEADFEQRSREFSRRAFDLETGPLWRVALVTIDRADGVAESRLLLCLHHIIADGWSIQLLLSEFVHCYRASIKGEMPSLTPLQVQYEDYSLWQRKTQEAGAGQVDLDYWVSKLQEQPPVLELPSDHPRPAQQSFRGERHSFALEASLATALTSFARDRGVTLFTVLLAAYKVQLFRLSGQTDLCVGVPIAGRTRPETESVIGLFVNTQILRSDMAGTQTFDQVLASVRQLSQEAQAHQDLPFEQLVDVLQPERSLSHNPLFQVLYNHQQREGEHFELTHELSCELMPQDSGAAQFDLALHTWESRDGAITGNWNYATDLFDRSTIEQMHTRFESLLSQMVAQPDRAIGDYDLLDETNREALSDWNSTSADYGQPIPVHQLFEQQALAYPDRVALVFADKTLTYAELDQQANQLAHALRAAGIGANSRVGVSAERSIELVVALYGIVKAGAAYVPIDPDHPQARKQQVLQDAGIDLLLTHDAVLERLPKVSDVTVWNLDQQDLSDQPISAAELVFHPNQPAYVIYTSGSTGKPKGVTNTHGAFFNRLQWMQAEYQLDVRDVVLQKTPYSFDVSVWEFFWPLMTGARLVIAEPGAHKDPAQLSGLIKKQHITTLHFVPSMLAAFMSQENLFANGLRRIICSGEALPKALQDQVLDRLPNAQLYNLYGPTEAAIDVTHWACRSDERHTVPIGQPIANLQIHILDARLNEQPIGVPGELYIGGAGLAQGYHGRPDLTAASFIPSPFTAGERLYRSGDLARWCKDGSLEYLGRLDHQIKLRGLRIELGEIETLLRDQPNVSDAVVVARKIGDSEQLVGYLQSQAADTDAIRAVLKQHLPDYMVPAHLMLLDRFPLSANGKLDRKALPDPEIETATYEAPQGEIEQTLAAIWQDVLNIERVGRNDNFFALGGDSILSLRIIAKARSHDIQLTPRDVFERQTIAELAQAAERANPDTAVYTIDASRPLPLTPIQHWFFEQAIPERSHWNQSLLLTPAEPLDLTALTTAITAVVKQHDTLRLAFTRDAEGQWQQHYQTEQLADDRVWSRNVALSSLQDCCDEAQASLDIERGELLRALHVRLAEGGERLLLVIHHLAVDGVSWRILLDDLQSAYEQARGAEVPVLGAKGVPFQVWAERLSELARSERLKQQREYWQNLPEPVPLPDTDRAGSNRMADRQTQTFQLDASLTQRLLTDAPKAYRTRINELLLTALGQALHQWTGESRHVIALEGHGREDLFEGMDLSRTVGWFTSLYPVQLAGGGNPEDDLKRNKEYLRQVPDGGIGYGLLRYQTGETNLPDLAGMIAFNYLGQTDSGNAGLLTLADELSGQQRNIEAPLGFAMALDGQVRQGRFEIACSYSGARHQASSVQALLDYYARALGDLVELCDGICARGNGVTPSDFPAVVLDQAALDALPVSAADIGDILPLTPMQQGLLFHSELGGADDLYVNQVSVAIDDLPAEAFKSAWQEAVSRHPVLRAAFIHAPGTQAPLQVIRRNAALSVRELDWRNAADAERKLEALCQSEKQPPFDFEAPPLMRLVLVRLTDSRWQMVWTLHHILLDGWSSAALMSEVLKSAMGEPTTAPAAYGDYFRWLARQDAEQNAYFWRGQLAEMGDPTRLMQFIRSDQNAQADDGEVVLTLERSALDTFARQHHLTLNTLVQAAWTLLLQRYTGQRQVIFGATVSGRPAQVANADRLMGLFINTLPVIQAPAPERTLVDWLSELQAHNMALREHEFTPLYDIQQWAGQAGRELFDTLLVFENFPVDQALRGSARGLQFGNVSISEKTHYPLSVAVQVGEQLSLHFHYKGDQVSRSQVQVLAYHAGQLLNAMVSQPAAHLADLPLLTEAEQAVWQAWNHPAHPPVDPRPLPALIAEQAQRRPDAMAVVHGAERVTFADFDRRANRLAHWLIGQSVGAESRVGVALERGVEMLVALYAVHKAGAAYVPLDPDYPAERVRYMLADSGAQLLLSHEASQDRLPDVDGVTTINLDTLDLSGSPDQVPEVIVHPEQLAYLIYTSGSTGKPKGVAVPHGAMSMHCQTIADRYGLTEDDRELHFLSISFDGAHERWLTPLSQGARVVLRDQALWSVQQTYDCLIEEGITVAAFPPSYLRQLAEWAELKGQPPGVRIYCFAGEAFSRQMMHHAITHLQPDWIINGYGPTETVVTPTLWRQAADTADFTSAYAPIGDLVGDRQGYVLDADLNLLPPGIAGELYLGGALARGYLDRPGITAERFVPNPFRAGERLYRTGDRVKLNRDGQLEYQGRMDQQVKLRGFRIEIGEVEAGLKGCAGVRETLAMVRTTVAGQRLVGYVAGDELDEATIKATLKQQLPDYMIPTHVVILERLPQLPNGKLDRNALPEPTVGNDAYEAPVTAMEHQLATLWQSLLKSERIGRYDNFFELGGHSLLATQLISTLRHEQGLDVPLRSIFEAPVLADLATLLEENDTLAGGTQIDAPKLSRVGLSRAPQSFAQQRLWFLDQLEPGSTAYHLPGILELRGAVDVSAMQRAVTLLAERHEVLRTRLVSAQECESLPQQCIDAVSVELTVTDLSDNSNPNIVFEQHAKAFMNAPFAMADAPLWRVELVRIAGDEWRLLLCMHHAISDGGSVQVLLRDIAAGYRAALAGRNPDWQPLPVQYADYAIWQRQWLGGGEGERQLTYWRAQLGNYQPVLELPTDYPRPARQSFKGARYYFALNASLADKVRALASGQGVTPFMVLLGAWQTLLHRLSGQDDIRVGVPIAGRTRPEVQELIGFFVNTQVLRSELAPAHTFGQVLRTVKEAALGAQENQDLPFEQLVEALQPERSLSHNPLFQVAYDHQQKIDSALTGLPGIEAKVLPFEDASTQFDLALNTLEDESWQLSGNWNYATDLFDRSTIEQMHTRFESLLSQMVAQPDRAIGDYDLLDETDREALSDWNSTSADFGQPIPVHQLFEKQALTYPDRVALVFADQTLTYAELDQRANQLAHALRTSGIGSNSRVGVSAERSIELVVSLYGIVKAGAAYVPIDPDHPQARKQQVLQDAGIDLLLTHNAATDRLPDMANVTVWNLDQKDLSDQLITAPNLVFHPNQPAYVIYTSGSTGKPKGVTNTHGALFNRLQWMQAEYELDASDAVLQKTPYSFDVSVWEFFWPLMTGARLVIAEPGAHKDPVQLSQIIKEQTITTLHFVPSMLAAFMSQENLFANSLRRIICSGEALPKALQDQVLDRLPNAQLYNLYGPTEAAIDVTHWACRSDGRHTVPIGQPIANLQIHILDGRLNAQPIGVPGELYIGGAGLAQGYHGRPDLTAASFIPSPFTPGERLYRSGDLARWCKDGSLEYLGRLDHQIKLRGLRIELGEIETLLREQPNVSDAVVVARKIGDSEQLVGYLQSQEADTDAIRTALKQHLPDYMVPAHLMLLDRFPLSANGKLDRKALPDPEIETATYEAPQGETEQTLAAIWQDVLNIERVGRNDNFFALGGHSLLGVQLVHRIQRELNRTLPLSAVFETHTFAEFAQQLSSESDESQTLMLEPQTRGVHSPQSFAQQRLWFLAQLEPESCAYHLPAGLRLTGELDEAALQTALEGLTQHHESLRTRFAHGDDGVPQQVICVDQAITLQHHDLRDRQDQFAELFQHFNQQPFDLEAAAPWRVALVRMAPDERRLLICMHHIMSDGWSMQVFVDELVDRYQAAVRGEAPELAPLSIQYPDYAIWQRKWLAGTHDRQLAWWRDQLGDEHPTLDLPSDRPRPSQRDGRGARHGFSLTADQSRRLRRLARDHQSSLFMVMLTGFEALLYRLTGQQDLRIGVPVAGRHQPATESLIGFFINTLVIRADIDAAADFAGLLQQTRERVLGAQAHADLPFEQLVEALQPERSLSHNPLFQVSYNHQVIDSSSLGNLDGLTCEPLVCPSENAHFDLVLGTIEQPDHDVIDGYLDFATDIFDVSTVLRLTEQLITLLDAATAEPTMRLSELPLLTEAEQAVWQDWNHPAHPPVDPRPLPALIAEQAQRRPDAMAVVHGAERVTFADFDRRANRLAHWLIGQGVGAESRVGVALERGVEMLVALYAVHKTGAAYVPLDPDYPAERVRYMLADSGAQLLLSHEASQDRLPDVDGVTTINLDTLDLSGSPDQVPEVIVHPEQLAYLIYTSGSTGKPKGVAVPHGAMSMHCQTIADRYGLTEDDRELHFLSISFDGAHERWLTPLSQGARVVLRDQALWSVQQTYDCLIEEGITVAAFPPSYLRQLAEWAELKGQPPGVRIYCFAGEAFSRQMMHHAITHLQPDWIINGYGPTETVVTPTLWRQAADTADFTSAYAPIGDLVGDRQGYVLDADLNLLPPGIAGELYLGGALARGYLDRPGITAERFVPNPFRAGERLYRTGDRVKLNRDGQLEYQGRMDQQVKLRGFRIEIGEVEAGLKGCAGVRETLAMVRTTAAGQRLVGYVAGDELDEATIKATLKQQLPDYMIPTHVVILDRLPQLPNGKLDRNALPEPETIVREREAPKGERECMLASLWQSTLGIDDVGRQDSFFELGGDSIQSLGLITRLRQQGWQLTPKQVFLKPHLADMAAALVEAITDEVAAPRAEGSVPLTPIQAHFFSQSWRQPAHWNQALMLEVARPLNVDYLHRAITALINQHDSLRLGFEQDLASGQWQGFYRNNESADRLLHVFECDNAEHFDTLCAQAQRSFDLKSGPLGAVLLGSMPGGEQRMLLVFHHLIVDGVSWRILLDDLVRIYQQLEAGHAPDAGMRSASYQQWAEYLQATVTRDDWAAEKDYWLKLQGTQEPWPVDNPDGRATHGDAANSDWSLPAEHTQQLLRETLAARNAGMDDLLLTALAEGLREWGGLTQPLVAVEGHGREQLENGPDAGRTVGWFTSLYPMRLNATGDIDKTFEAVAGARADLPAKGVGFGLLRYLGTSDCRAALAAIAEPKVAFNYLGQFNTDLGDGRFKPLPVDASELVGPHEPLLRELEINGQIHGGQLTLSCRYSRQRYRQRTVQRLLAAVGSALESLIAHSVPVVEAQAEDAPAQTVNPLIRLGSGESGKPRLYCPHPVSGTVVGYYPLAARLSHHWDVWGFQNRQLLDARWRDTSLVAMARDYVRDLLQQQPHGPYHLLGWSMGGALALEMARLLERLGKSVAFVGLIDGYVPGAGKPRNDADNPASPDGVSDDQWQQLLALERHMRSLAREHTEVRPLKAPVYAWWASQSPENNQDAEALLTAAIGRPLSLSAWIDADHLGIVRDASFMADLKARLGLISGSMVTDANNVSG